MKVYNSPNARNARIQKDQKKNFGSEKGSTVALHFSADFVRQISKIHIHENLKFSKCCLKQNSPNARILKLMEFLFVEFVKFKMTSRAEFENSPQPCRLENLCQLPKIHKL